MPTRKLRPLLIAALATLAVPAAHAADTCGAEMLKGKYVLSSTGFTRPANSGPGTPWTPKAIVEVLALNGEGAVTTPVLIAANAFGDLGNILQPPGGGAPGAYIVNEDCTGKMHFFDAAGVMFAIYVEPSGDAFHMIQINPANNVSQTTARRVSK